MPLLPPGYAQGITQGLDQYQLRQMRDQQMQEEQFRLDALRQQQARDARSRQLMGMIPPPQMPTPQPPAPGQPSVPMMQPGQGMAPQQPPPIPPYQTVQSVGAQQAQAAPQAPPGGMAPPPVTPQAPRYTVDGVMSELTKQGVPLDEQIGVLQQLAPVFNMQGAEEKQKFSDRINELNLKIKERELQQPMYPKQGPTRELSLPGDKVQTQQMQPDGTWVDVGAPRSRFAKLAVGAGDINLPKLDQATIDFYAKQSLAGDNSWQVGLARGKVGQQLIAAVKDRIPQLAKETGQSPQDVSSNKAQMAALTKTLADRQKYSTAVEQLQGTLTKQADLVESLLAKGASGAGSPVLNKWLQAGRKATGDPDVRAFNAAIVGLAREHQRVLTSPLSNAQLHASSQETADTLLNTADTPDAIRAVIGVMRKEAANGKLQADETVSELKAKLAGLGKGTSATPKVVDWTELK